VVVEAVDTMLVVVQGVERTAATLAATAASVEAADRPTAVLAESSIMLEALVLNITAAL
jgi:hypothetical protein